MVVGTTVKTVGSNTSGGEKSHKEAVRLLTVKGGKAELGVYLPLSAWQDGEELKGSIVASDDASACDLLFGLIEKAKAAGLSRFLELLMDELETNYLKGNDPHAVLPGLLRTVGVEEGLAVYYSNVPQLPKRTPGVLSLAQSGQANLMCVFGGQGNTEDYIGEVEGIMATYEALIRDLFIVQSQALFTVSGGTIDLSAWVRRRPQDPVLVQAPSVSLPLAGIIQLLNYAVFARGTGTNIGGLSDYFSRFTGHSQGIVSAVVAAGSHSDQEFLELSEKAIKMLYFIGLQAEQAHPRTSLPPSVLNDCAQHHEGVPSPMLSISSLNADQVQQHVRAANAILPENRRIHVSLHNGPRSFVCSGPAISLHGLNVALRKIKAEHGVDQSRVPHSKRKLKFSTRFLPITAPFHCQYLEGAVELILKDMSDQGLSFDSLTLKKPVASPFSGEDLLLTGLTRELVTLICTKPVHWCQATASSGITHVVDFGPGGAGGIGVLTFRNKEGSGVRVVLGSCINSHISEVDDRRSLFDRRVDRVKFGVNWRTEFGPKVLRRESDGKLFVDTRFSRLLGLPPLMVAGMTPCTVSQSFVSACINAGYHVELAGGGHFTEQMVRDKIDAVLEDIPAGRGITLNSLFLNPRLWSLQYPLMKKMRAEGYPIEGFCVAAGVPSLENANEIVRSLVDAGIRHISFKPGSTESIYQVISIARHNPDIPIVLQWTGGRGGGHHSFEDFHQPILETYAAIRAQPNLILVAGSGFGDGPDSLPYLTGEWSERFSYPWMPFDGILLGSRVMVARESAASDPVKELLVAAPGADRETDWEGTYSGPVGNVITVKSELGEPIHKIATRAVLLWKELDEQVFSQPRGEKRMRALLDRRSYWIDRLNKDHLKVWFGRRTDGSVCDLEEMTYAEIVIRLVDLCYLSDQERWIDGTYRQLIYEFLVLAQSRFCDKEEAPAVPSADALIIDPHLTISAFISKYPQTVASIIRSEDIDAFLQLCMNPARKPVPFIPALDDNFESWFKKDSLWASEDVEAVFGKDVQRTCILQGPVSVKYSHEKNMPIKQILDGISDYYLEQLQRRNDTVGTVSWFGLSNANHVISAPSDEFVELGGETCLSPTSQEDRGAWIARLTGNRQDWFTAALQSGTVVGEEKRLEQNPFISLFKPRPGYEYRVRVDSEGQTEFVTIEHHGQTIVKADCTANIVELAVNHQAKELVSLKLTFRFSPEYAPALLHVDWESREAQIRRFYYSLWFGEENIGELEGLNELDTLSNAISHTVAVDSAQIRQFCASVGNSCAAYSGLLGELQAPLDFAVLLAWKSIIQCLFTRPGFGNLLQLVHLRNRIEAVNSFRLMPGDQIETNARISGITETLECKTVEVTAECRKLGVVGMTVVTAFLYRKNRPSRLFIRFPATNWRIPIRSTEDVAMLADLLRAKSWFAPIPNWHMKVSVGYDLVFVIDEKTAIPCPNDPGFDNIIVSGHVIAIFAGHLSVPCGQISFYSNNFIKADPVEEFCRRHHGIASAADLKTFSDSPGMVPLGIVSAPLNATKYSQISGDHNPIHTHELIADLLGLPAGPIIHGMWTSAAVRAVLEVHLAENSPQRTVEYESRFTDMLPPGTLISVSAEHIGMQNGRLVYNFEGRISGQEVKVIEGRAVIDQPSTTYLFTGQGSQRVGMGMDLYEESDVARAIWDRADRHFLKAFGVSIIEIVKNNPKELVVHFGGLRGQQIRRNYINLTVEDPVSKANKQLLPSVTEESESYTFYSPAGLLHATQFTQPALTLVAKAAFEDMKAKGLVAGNCAFAGHSLGEYASLAAVGDIIPIESLCDIVFYRGLTMQSAVSRDAEGRSEYGMIAVNPFRISPEFKEDGLKFVVEGMAACLGAGSLVEIVNYNIQDGQYVLAGDLRSLEILTQTLNYIKHKAVQIAGYFKSASLEIVKEQLRGMVCQVAVEVDKRGKIRKVSKGYASVQLVGIDVPFHSSFLLGGVGPFRSILRRKLDPALVSTERLCGRYIPNLVGCLFDLTPEFCQRVFEASNSPVVGKMLKSFPELSDDESRQLFAHTLLVELLAYQFASPVQWIRTQDVLFGEMRVERVVEIGPTAILAGMAEKTIKLKYAAQDDVLSTKRTIWSYSGNRSDIYYEARAPNGGGSSCELPDTGTKSASQSLVNQEPVIREPIVTLAPRPLQAARTNASVSFTALDSLLLTLAVKMRKPLKEVSGQRSIKELSGGKSTLQNELLTDLQREFGDSGMPDRPEELPLHELAGALPDYSKAPRKHTASLLNKLWSAKLPAGYSMQSAKSYLETEYGLDSESVNCIILFGAALEPEKRLDDADVKVWLDSLTEFVAEVKRVSIGKNMASSATASVAVTCAELQTLQQGQRQLAQIQLESLRAYLGEREGEGLRKVLSAKQQQIEQLEDELAVWRGEHGSDYAVGIRPLFSPPKARLFDSYWNWSKQELFYLMAEAVNGRLEPISRQLMERCGRLLSKSEPEVIAFMEYHLVQRRGELLEKSVSNPGYATLLRLGTELLDLMREAVKQPVKYRDLSHPTCPVVSFNPDGTVKYQEGLRKETRNFVKYVDEMSRPFIQRPSGKSFVVKVKSVKSKLKPLLSLRKTDPEDPLHFVYSPSATSELFECMREVAKDGLCLSKKTALITGCGRGSIGAEVLRALLTAGAMVVATTSSYSRTTVKYYRELYEECGARGSVLVVVPFNQASVQDIDKLVDYIQSELKWNLDYLLPFAAINEAGAAIDNLSGKNDLAHRAMLSNIHRLIGTVVKSKQTDTRPVHCVVPLSPNQGSFGGDGFYGESKAGLQTLLHRWSAEQWRDRATLVGAVIGWTRGTGLMNDNNLLAAAMEGELGIRTFSPREMAFNIVCLLHPRLLSQALCKPIYADLSGGLSYLKQLHKAASDVRNKLVSASRLKRAIWKESEAEAGLITRMKTAAAGTVRPRSALNFHFNAPERGDLQLGAKLRKLLDLDRIVVVVGYGEVGPLGSARTRWEMELNNRLSLAGYIELALAMGLIKYERSTLFGKYSGWVDAKSREPVDEADIPTRYGDYILKHTGIRLIEPEIMYGYDPERKEMCQDHVLTQDLPFFEVSKEEAEAYLRMHGPDLVEITRKDGEERVLFRLKKGAKISIPKAIQMDRLVAGLLPTGWDARRFGVPDDIARQVDPVSLYNLVSTCEALLSAGIIDPYELYQFTHPTAVGNCCGGGEGGLRSNQRIFKDRYFDHPVQSDILQESFINTMPAWVNLLLLSASGPAKSPVGACATAVQSVELGVECIQAGRAQVVIVGGYDDISEESSSEFAAMQATSNTRDEYRRGREPSEMCRPAASSRAGFMESHGAGTQVLMSARLALEMGCPVYGIVAGTNTASDRQGRSIPAPGQGLLGTARKMEDGKNPLLDINYRVKLFDSMNYAELGSLLPDPRAINIRLKAQKQAFGHEFYKNDPQIAPLEGILAQFGLSIDNIGMASFHGTGTKANDINESDVLQKQLVHLGRSIGNPLPCVFQKHLTGHPKGAACAWMLNGALQAMEHRGIPGNRNADNIDGMLRSKSFLLFPSQSLPVDALDAVIIKSFGFGQVGGEAVVVNPAIFYSMLTDAEYGEYVGKRRNRELKAMRYYNNSILGGNMVRVKTAAPYPDDKQTEVLLNPLMRLTSDGTWRQVDHFNLLQHIPKDAVACGVDIQCIPDLSSHIPIASDDHFLDRNFTANELERIAQKPDQLSSLVGMWAAKEAAFKALCQAGLLQGRGAGAGLKELELKYGPAPSIEYGGRCVKLGISHSGDYAIAIAFL